MANKARCVQKLPTRISTSLHTNYFRTPKQTTLAFPTKLISSLRDDPALWRIAEIIHQADIEDDRFDAPEAAGLEICLRREALGTVP